MTHFGAFVVNLNLSLSISEPFISNSLLKAFKDNTRFQVIVLKIAKLRNFAERGRRLFMRLSAIPIVLWIMHAYAPVLYRPPRELSRYIRYFTFLHQNSNFIDFMSRFYLVMLICEYLIFVSHAKK